MIRVPSAGSFSANSLKEWRISSRSLKKSRWSASIFRMMPVSYTHLDVYKRQDKVLQIDEYMTEDIKGQLLPGVLDYFTFDEKLYGLPTKMSTCHLFINKKIMEENNVEIPTTYSELLEACKILRENGVTPIALGEMCIRDSCESDGELLSVADGDLEMLLGGISEAVYENTVSIGQMKSRTGDALLLELRNYLSSYQESGDGKLNVDKALLLLKEKKKEWLNRMQLRIQMCIRDRHCTVSGITLKIRETMELKIMLLTGYSSFRESGRAEGLKAIIF